MLHAEIFDAVNDSPRYSISNALGRDNTLDKPLWLMLHSSKTKCLSGVLVLEPSCLGGPSMMLTHDSFIHCKVGCKNSWKLRESMSQYGDFGPFICRVTYTHELVLILNTLADIRKNGQICEHLTVPMGIAEP